MAIELKIPEVGESITEVEIGDWLKVEGDSVRRDEPLVTLESEKATVELSAPESGKITKALKRKGDVAKVGEVIGYLEAEAQQKSDTAPAAAKAERQSAEGAKRKEQSIASEPKTPQPSVTQPVPQERAGNLKPEKVQTPESGERAREEDLTR